MKQSLFQYFVYLFIITQVNWMSVEGQAQPNRVNIGQTKTSIDPLRNALKSIDDQSRWRDKGAIALIEQYVKSVDPALQNMSLVETGFSSATQGRFKQVSPSFLILLAKWNPAQFGLLTQTLLSIKSVRLRMYSLWLSYRLLDMDAEWLKESHLYMYSLMNDSFFESHEHLKMRFKKRIEQWLIALKSKADKSVLDQEVRSNIRQLNSKMVIDDLDFWMRRELDGSRQILSKLLFAMVRDSDQRWQILFKWVQAPHGQPLLTNKELTLLFKPAMISLMKGFDGQEGRQMYKGDLLGILKDGQLNQGVYEVLGQPQAKLHWMKLWTNFSGIKVEKSLEENEKKRPFLFVNPQFIFWTFDHLIPTLEYPSSHAMVRRLIHQIYRRLFDLLSESRIHLYERMNVKAEKMEYALARLSPEFSEKTYLRNRYQNILQDKYPEKGELIFQPADAIGFWLRRDIDGTSLYLWGGLVHLRHIFDLEDSKY
jgi:hypothetical protein